MAKKILVFIASIAASFTAAGIGSLATLPNIPLWYEALQKPPLNPPNWLFGPVWSVLYLLMGIALALVIIEANKRPKKAAYVWFCLQLALNATWSIVFFGFHSPLLGVAVILVLIVSIVATMREFYRIKPIATWLLVPYLVWVSFATYLTVGIAVLNR